MTPLGGRVTNRSNSGGGGTGARRQPSTSMMSKSTGRRRRGFFPATRLGLLQPPPFPPASSRISWYRSSPLEALSSLDGLLPAGSSGSYLSRRGGGFGHCGLFLIRAGCRRVRTARRLHVPPTTASLSLNRSLCSAMIRASYRVMPRCLSWSTVAWSLSPPVGDEAPSSCRRLE